MRIVNYKNALTRRVVILKKAIAETSIWNGGLLCGYLLKWHHGFKVLPCDYLMYFVGNEIDLFYEKALKYQHHAENYKESLAQDITSFGL